MLHSPLIFFKLYSHNIGSSGALVARTDIPKECHFLNDDASSRKMICEYTSTDASSVPVFESNLPGACTPDPTGEFDIACKLPAGAKGFSINNSKRDVAAEAYKFSLVCDDTGCHYGNVARDIEAEAYKFSISIEWKRDEASVLERAVATAEQEAYKFSISIEW